MKRTSDVVIAGPPRSGTTLLCALLNKCADVVALSEPLDVNAIVTPRRRRLMVRKIAAWYDATRADLTSSGTATAKVLDGSLDTTNYALDQIDPATGRRMRAGAERQSIGVDKELSPDFLLAAKHPALFTALAPDLQRRFRVVGIVRNPLALLASWSTVDMPVGRGHLPFAERVDRRLQFRLRRTDGVLDRQVMLLEWAFDRMSRLDPDAVVRYEDMINSNGTALAAITPSAEALREDLVSGNVAKHYEPETVERLADRLRRQRGSFLRWYSAREIDALAAEIAGR